MRILLLGGGGMAGSMIAAYMRRNTAHELIATVRPGSAEAVKGPAFQGLRVIELDVRDLKAVEDAVRLTKPDVLVNAAGILNQHAEDHPLDAYLVNGMLPHWLANLADREGARLLHISSDCVFSGERGRYSESDKPDGRSVYAKSKALGEVKDGRHLTIRTSIIGPDSKPHGIGLLQWFLAQKGTVAGYRNVLWNGVTTLELAKTIDRLLGHPEASGLMHLTASEIVSKHELLGMMRAAFDRNDIEIVPSDEPVIDRTLVVTRDDLHVRPAPYAQMLAELHRWMNRS